MREYEDDDTMRNIIVARWEALPLYVREHYPYRTPDELEGARNTERLLTRALNAMWGPNE